MEHKQYSRENNEIILLSMRITIILKVEGKIFAIIYDGACRIFDRERNISIGKQQKQGVINV